MWSGAVKGYATCGDGCDGRGEGDGGDGMKEVRGGWLGIVGLEDCRIIDMIKGIGMSKHHKIRLIPK